MSLEDIRQYALADYDRGEMMNTTIRLGASNGTPVIVEHPCLDICPDYTVRIIRYDVPLEECAAAGGYIVSAMIPWALGQIVREFCSPLAPSPAAVE